MGAVLHVISDRQKQAAPIHHALLQAAKGGADIIQIREKKTPAAEIYELCSLIQSELANMSNRSQLFVNDRLDVALAIGAQGVHLAARSLPIPIAKVVLAKAAFSGVVGVSVHSLDEALIAERAGADYITFGHIYASESHCGEPARGLWALQRVVDAVKIPVVAIGGINPQNVVPVLDTGCSGIAVIGAVVHQLNPLAAVLRLKEQMAKAHIKPKFPFPLGGESYATNV